MVASRERTRRSPTSLEKPGARRADRSAPYSVWTKRDPPAWRRCPVSTSSGRDGTGDRAGHRDPHSPSVPCASATASGAIANPTMRSRSCACAMVLPNLAGWSRAIAGRPTVAQVSTRCVRPLVLSAAPAKRKDLETPRSRRKNCGILPEVPDWAPCGYPRALPLDATFQRSCRILPQSLRNLAQ